MTLQSSSHASVLLEEVLELLLKDDTRVFYDGTLGLGGHAEAVLKSAPNLKIYIGTDLDKQHLDFAQERLKNWESKLSLNLGNFSQIREFWPAERVAGETASILLDLGLCSNQLDDKEKGFAFAADGPLNMSFDGDASHAEKVVNEMSEAEISRILQEYGEEPQARKIARKMIEFRQHQPIRTTGELRGIVETNVHPKDRKKALTRVFQAIRIAVNQELDHLEKVLDEALDLMQPGDLIGVMSYHSLEDRIVKKFFKKQSTPVTKETDFSLHEEVAPAQLKLITKKFVSPTAAEIEANPRARSAKFRVAQKI